MTLTEELETLEHNLGLANPGIIVARQRTQEGKLQWCLVMPMGSFSADTIEECVELAKSKLGGR